MKLLPSKRLRALFLLPLAATLQAQKAPEYCRHVEGSGKQIEPILLLATQPGLSTPVQNGAVVAEEVMQIAEESWMLQDELRVAEEKLIFPSGTRLHEDYPSKEAKCLPMAPRSAGAARRPLAGRLVCLVDGDGDGRFEQMKFYGADYAMHVPQARLYRTVALATPIVLAPNPLGDSYGHRRISRRLIVGTVEGNRARFIVRHRYSEPLYTARTGGRWDAGTDDALVYRLPPPIPVPVEWAGQEPSANSLVGEQVELAEGKEFEIGGMKLVVEDAGSSSMSYRWQVRLTTPRFPRWISFSCDGRLIKLLGDDR